MVYICVRTYGNGQFMNRVHPVYYLYLSQAQEAVNELNKQDPDCIDPGSNKWIFMPISEFMGPVR